MNGNGNYYKSIVRKIDNGIDIIGDIHACYDEFIELLQKLNYTKNKDGIYIHEEGRKIVSLGDIMSRGPKSLETMQWFLRQIAFGNTYMIDSNHGWKIARWLDGKKVTLKHGDENVENELQQFEQKYGKRDTRKLVYELKEMLLYAPSHYIFKKQGVQTVVCTHGGIRDDFIGKQSKRISDFCRYGDTAGFDENGKPIRLDWFLKHNSNELIVWGHDPKLEPLETNNTINIDQGAVFGGKLTAFRYPEKEFVFVKAKENYSGRTDNEIAIHNMKK